MAGAGVFCHVGHGFTGDVVDGFGHGLRQRWQRVDVDCVVQLAGDGGNALRQNGGELCACERCRDEVLQDAAHLPHGAAHLPVQDGEEFTRPLLLRRQRVPQRLQPKPHTGERRPQAVVQVPAQAFAFPGGGVHHGVALFLELFSQCHGMDDGGQLRSHGPQHPLVPAGVALPRGSPVHFKGAQAAPAQGKGCAEAGHGRGQGCVHGGWSTRGGRSARGREGAAVGLQDAHPGRADGLAHPVEEHVQEFVLRRPGAKGPPLGEGSQRVRAPAVQDSVDDLLEAVAQRAQAHGHQHRSGDGGERVPCEVKAGGGQHQGVDANDRCGEHAVDQPAPQHGLDPQQPVAQHAHGDGGGEQVQAQGPQPVPGDAGAKELGGEQGHDRCQQPGQLRALGLARPHQAHHTHAPHGKQPCPEEQGREPGRCNQDSGSRRPRVERVHDPLELQQPSSGNHHHAGQQPSTAGPPPRRIQYRQQPQHHVNGEARNHAQQQHRGAPDPGVCGVQHSKEARIGQILLGQAQLCQRAHRQDDPAEHIARPQPGQQRTHAGPGQPRHGFGHRWQQMQRLRAQC